MTWVGLSSEQVADEATDPDLPKWFRVYLLAMSRLKANGHAQFGHGELGRLVGTDAETGEERYDRNVKRYVERAVEKGRLLPGSTVRCLQVANFRSADGKKDDKCQTCLTEKVKSVTSSGRSLGARSSSVPQDVPSERIKREVSLTRGDASESTLPVSQKHSPEECFEGGKHSPQECFEEQDKESAEAKHSPGEVVEEPAAPKLVLVVDDTTADPDADRIRIKRHFKTNVDTFMPLAQVASDLDLPLAFVEKVCQALRQSSWLDVNRKQQTYARTHYAEERMY